ncbi:hypothetical protein PIB30_070837 [Stylosanthes scabra]|uniref:Uncharacterized protein n=1 Tax=Stylosanthes scabra TaxID=79078 RepID=A0ABU6QP08_9FABA|nr:hypothetical protein [Stylosanthes scabra]
MLSLEPFTEDQTPWSVFHDGPNGEPTGRRPECAGAEARQQARAAFHNRDDDVSAGLLTARAWATVAIRGCIPKQPDSQTAPRGATGSGHNGALILSGDPFQGTWARSAIEDASPDYNSDAKGDRLSWGALPAPPNLRSRSGQSESSVGRRALKGGGGRAAGSEVRTGPPSVVVLLPTKSPQACPQPKGFGRNLRSKTRWFTGFCNSYQVSHFAMFFIDARAEISIAESRSGPIAHGQPFPAQGLSEDAFADRSWGIDNDPSACSPTETLLRLLLPLNDKVQWTSHNVAGSEPPTSPRSEHFTGPFNRLPGPVGQGYRLVEYISVARVRPRTSKGITDLLLPRQLSKLEPVPEKSDNIRNENPQPMDSQYG